jgi:hypothetical protein
MLLCSHAERRIASQIGTAEGYAPASRCDGQASAAIATSGASLPAHPRPVSVVSTPARRGSHDAGTCRWETIRYALDSTARTLRLCLIVLVAGIPPGLLMLLVRR